MLDVPLVMQIVKRKGIANWLIEDYQVDKESIDDDAWAEMVDDVTNQFVRIRCLHDFPFWAYMFVMIHPKGEGDDIPFKLNRQQRILVGKYEAQRLTDKPIRVVLAKSRQWGGSTVTQIYGMATTRSQDRSQ